MYNDWCDYNVCTTVCSKEFRWCVVLYHLCDCVVTLLSSCEMASIKEQITHMKFCVKVNKTAKFATMRLLVKWRPTNGTKVEKSNRKWWCVRMTNFDNWFSGWPSERHLYKSLTNSTGITKRDRKIQWLMSCNFNRKFCNALGLSKISARALHRRSENSFHFNLRWSPVMNKQQKCQRWGLVICVLQWNQSQSLIWNNCDSLHPKKHKYTCKWKHYHGILYHEFIAVG
jgi:hypothetical protein